MEAITRRTFCQLALAAACSQSLSAAGSLSGQFNARVNGGLLEVDLVLHNRGDSAVDVLLKQGLKLAIHVEGKLGSWPLRAETLAYPEAMTRAGPRLVWGPVPPRGQLFGGTYRFALPEGAGAAPLPTADFKALVQTYQGSLQLNAEGVHIATDS